MTTILYLIRHGETDWNATRRWQGHANVPLNDRGLRQAQLVAQRLQAEQVRFDAIYSSDLTRAYQTAWEIGAAVKVAVQLLPPLREIDMGEWSGLTRDQIRERYSVEYRLLEEGQDIPRGGGETLSALRNRVLDTVDALVYHNPDKTIVLVTHGGPIRAILKHIAGSSGMSVPPATHIGNTSITIIHCQADSWQIMSCNDMHHLQDLEPDLVSAPPDDAEQPQE